jgi:CHASE3 domain sensor protein
VRTVLEEIRELQRAHFEEYRKVTQESLAIQRKAVSDQQKVQKVGRVVVLVAGLLIVIVLLMIMRVVGRL